MAAYRPDIYLFNPTCEYAVANGHLSWQPTRLLQKMEKDLETLPLFFARPDDVILLSKELPTTYLSTLAQIGISVPRSVLRGTISKNETFLHKHKNRLLPWGWSPAAHHLLNPLKPSCSATFQNSPAARWSPGHREVRSKRFALEVLKDLLPHLPPETVLTPGALPQICTSKTDLQQLIQKWGKIMVKAPWSSSGRGLQRITRTPVVEKVWEKLLGIIHSQGYAMAEPLHRKVLDMALQFRMTNGKIHYSGISRFLTDEKGQYQGNFLNGWPENVPAEITGFADEVPEFIVNPLANVLQKSRLVNHYEGPFGVDVLIFRDESGQLRLHPCLEINVRYNMGLLSLHLSNFLASEKKGLFKTFYSPGKSFRQFQTEMEQKYPLNLQNAKITSGFFPVTPVSDDTKFGAYILIPG